MTVLQTFYICSIHHYIKYKLCNYVKSRCTSVILHGVTKYNTVLALCIIVQIILFTVLHILNI